MSVSKSVPPSRKVPPIKAPLKVHRTLVGLSPFAVDTEGANGHQVARPSTPPAGPVAQRPDPPPPRRPATSARRISSPPPRTAPKPRTATSHGFPAATPPPLPTGTPSARITRPASSEVEEKKLAFAQTVAVDNARPFPIAGEIERGLDAAPAQPASDASAAEPPATIGLTIPEVPATAAQPTPVQPRVAASLESVEGTHPEAPSIPMSTFRWEGKRRTWIAAGAVSSLALALATFATKRVGIARTAAPAMQLQLTDMPNGEPTRSVPRAPVEVPPVEKVAPPADPAPSTVATPKAGALVAGADESSNKDEAVSDDLKSRGLANITVHSLTAYASVYVMFTKYGPVEGKLVVPCGKRFIAIGIPKRDSKEPTWLAPGKLVEIPCGGSVEMTMNPRRMDVRSKDVR